MRMLRLGPMVPLVVVGGLVAWGWGGASPAHRANEGPPPAVTAAESEGVDPTTLLVDFRDDVGDATLATNAWTEEAISAYSAVDRLYRVRFPSAEAAARAADQLRRDGTVESVDLDVEFSIPPEETFAADPGTFVECATASAENAGFPNDPCFHYQWHLRQVGLPTAWKAGQGEGVIVAVIDTGVTKVPDLGDTKFVAGYNFVANNANAMDDHGHGTHVAGTIAQATNNKLGVGGVAFGASIMPLKVLTADGRGSVGGIAQAIRWAADHGAKVINMSLGGPLPTSVLKSAVAYARNKGVVVIAAAGNDGRGRVSYPAKYPGVVAVASTQFDERTTFYSNWGKEIDLSAPGGNTRVDQNGDGKPDGVLQNTVVPGNTSKTDYLWFMGTSMASPHVAGVTALIMGAGVTKPDAVEAILLGTSRQPKGAKDAVNGRVDDHYGAGIVDAGAALKKARGGRAAGTVGLGASIALLGVGLLRRRRAAIGAGFVVSLLAGAVALPEGLTWLMGAGAFANPLILSAALPLLAVGLGYGVARLRPALAGLAFGVAGVLAFAAIALIADVRFVPDFLDRAWLAANALLATVLGIAALRKD